MSFKKIIEAHHPKNIALLGADNVCLTWGQIIKLLRSIEINLNFYEDGRIFQVGPDTSFENILAFTFACYSGVSIEIVETSASTEVENKLASLIGDICKNPEKSVQVNKFGKKQSVIDRCNQEIILETSGTTGSRKKIVHGIVSLEYQARMVSKKLDLSVDHRQLAYMPLNYVYGMSVILTWLQSGSSLAISRHLPQSLGKFFDEILRTKVTLFSAVPHTYLLMNRWGFHNLSNSKIRCLTQAGGFLPKAVKNKLIKENPEIDLFVMYGQTEFCGRISMGLYRENTAPNFAGSILEEVSAIVDENGELFINSPSVCLNADKIMKQLNHRGKLYYSTGDIGHVVGQELFVNGRNQNFIKVGGKRLPQKDIVFLIEKNEEINSVYLTNGIDRSEKVLIGIHIEPIDSEGNSYDELISKLERPFKVELKKLLGNTGYRIYILSGPLPTLANGKVDALQISEILKDTFVEKKPVHIRL